VECEDRRVAVTRERTRLKEKVRRLQKAYFNVEIDEDTYRRERDEAQVELYALVIPEEPDVVAAGQFLETFADIWIEAIPKERKELLGLLLEEVFVDVAEDRIVCVRPKASFVALFQQVPGLEERDGCFHFASNRVS
jgi:hypothetical protein